tara:strand:- start:50 stop:259 length:210 start_codon:yes stop_codon:yes gene_type:complete
MELKFKNNSIEKYKNDSKDFFDKKDRSKSVFTSFGLGTKYKDRRQGGQERDLTADTKLFRNLFSHDFTY